MKQIIFFFFLSISLSAQIKGVVKDSISGKPIPYVNIWVENENLGTTSEEDGSFSLDLKEEKKLVFSALGYEIKTVSSKDIATVLLVQKVYEMPEIVVTAPLKKEEIIVGDFTGIRLNSGVTNVGQDNVHIWARIFESTANIKNHPYVRIVEFVTESRVKNAKIRLRFYENTKNESNYKDLIQENIIIEVKKGKRNNIVDLSNYNIKIPDEGIVIGFEYLKLEQNRYEYTYTNQGEKGRHKGFSYEPTIKGFFIDGISSKIALNQYGEIVYPSSSIELAIKLTLTN